MFPYSLRRQHVCCKYFSIDAVVKKMFSLVVWSVKLGACDVDAKRHLKSKVYDYCCVVNGGEERGIQCDTDQWYECRDAATYRNFHLSIGFLSVDGFCHKKFNILSSEEKNFRSGILVQMHRWKIKGILPTPQPEFIFNFMFAFG